MSIENHRDGASEESGNTPRFNIFDFLGRQTSKLQAVLGLQSEQYTPQAILPHSVRLNLRTSGQLDTKDIRNLVQHQAWASIGMCFALKIIRDDVPSQKALLQDLCTAITSTSDVQTSELVSIVEPYLKDVDEKMPTKTFKGAKAAQLSRQGPTFFRNRFEGFATTIKERDETPCLAAHSGFMALPAFLRTLDEHKKIGIVFPKRLEIAKPGDLCGYVLNRNSGDVRVEEWNLDSDVREQLGTEIVLIDDTKGTGKTSDMIKEVFDQHSENLPHILRDEHAVYANGK